GDGEAHHAVGALEPDASLLRFRMLRDVSERFLRDAVEGERGSRRQRNAVGRHLARGGNAAALRGLRAIRRRRLPEPGFVEDAGVKLVREVTDVRADLDELFLGARDRGLCRRFGWKLNLGRPEIERHGAELLEDGVVELARDARAL